MRRRRSQPSSQSPLEILRAARWNVFEDFSAFRTYFFLLVMAYLAYAIWHAFSGQFHRAGSATLITAASLLPLFLWTRGNLPGLPIYPLFSFTFFYTFALQILTREEITDVRGHFVLTGQELWNIGMIVSISLFAGCWAWYLVIRKPAPAPPLCHTFRESFLVPALLFLFAASSLIIAAIATEKFPVPFGLHTVFRAFAGTAGSVAGFILAYQMGKGILSVPGRWLFLSFLFLQIIASAASLYLIGAISLAGVTIAGYTLGKRRVPWLILFIAAPLMFILHEGKGDMRVKYWNRETAVASVKLGDYPAYFTEWIQAGLRNLEKDSGTDHEAETNLIERSGLIQIFVTAYKLSPETAPYLKGSTYKSIPVLMIPRMFYPDKPLAHEGQREMNIHYYLQTRETVGGTSIGWGLFNEAYANFGISGCLMFSILFGMLTARVSRMAANVPLLSFRGMIGVLFLAMCLQTEMASGIWASSLFQAIIILIAIRFGLMVPTPNPVAGTAAGSPPLRRRASSHSVRKLK